MKIEKGDWVTAIIMTIIISIGGCAMEGDDIITERNKCIKVGLTPYYDTKFADGSGPIIRVYCLPKKGGKNEHRRTSL